MPLASFFSSHVFLAPCREVALPPAQSAPPTMLCCICVFPYHAVLHLRVFPPLQGGRLRRQPGQLRVCAPAGQQGGLAAGPECSRTRRLGSDGGCAAPGEAGNTPGCTRFGVPATPAQRSWVAWIRWCLRSGRWVLHCQARGRWETGYRQARLLLNDARHLSDRCQAPTDMHMSCMGSCSKLASSACLRLSVHPIYL